VVLAVKKVDGGEVEDADAAAASLLRHRTRRLP
jgi:hypothetical protein